MIETYVGMDPGGYFVEWFDEEDERVSRWYGSHIECEDRAKGPLPGPEFWCSIYAEGAPPHDHATATGMYDRIF